MRLIGKRILVVEDEPIVAMMIEDILTEQGAIVVGPVTKIADALELAKTVEIDAGFLDVNINGQLSRPVAEALRAREIPFVYATGYGSSITIDDVETPILQKPYVARQVIAVIEQIFTGATAELVRSAADAKP